ncbi:hypothetical protein INT44_004146 [Umbelopsis vinacea]|uniref:Uncharacterized protein n=1 Tax=Umbelopsis vinacea TaxID=44442 RepID=A0A8H7QBU0_9FUNG|nr:hypothetical protein INT44_004146 [Umbelopsis vinacea]
MQVQERDLEESRNHSNESDFSATVDPNNTTREDPPIDSAEEEKPKKQMDLLSNPIFSGFLLIVAGCALAIQAGANANLNKYGGRSFATVISFLTGLIVVLLFFVIDVTALRTPLPNSNLKAMLLKIRNNCSEAPWYAWIGGICGGYYVIINVLTVPRLGTATVLSIFVCAQIIFASIIDHFGLLGVAQRDYTVWRILASLGLVGCVVVIAKF